MRQPCAGLSAERTAELKSIFNQADAYRFADATKQLPPHMRHSTRAMRTRLILASSCSLPRGPADSGCRFRRPVRKSWARSSRNLALKHPRPVTTSRSHTLSTMYAHGRPPHYHTSQPGNLERNASSTYHLAYFRHWVYFARCSRQTSALPERRRDSCARRRHRSTRARCTRSPFDLYAVQCVPTQPRITFARGHAGNLHELQVC